MSLDRKEKIHSYLIKLIWWILFGIIVLVFIFFSGPFIRAIAELFK